MQTSGPKLKAARAEIEALLKRYDIAGVVVLHEPGFGEQFWFLHPAYSKLTGDFPVFRLRSKVSDYGGDRAAQKADLEATGNMARLLADMLGGVELNFINLADWVDERLGLEHVDKEFTPDKPKAH